MPMSDIDLTRLREQNVLVVGGTGFLGSHLVRSLSRFGARVVGMSRSQHPLVFLGGEVTRATPRKFRLCSMLCAQVSFIN